MGNDEVMDLGTDSSPTEDTDRLDDFLTAPPKLGWSVSATPAPFIASKRLLLCTRE